uniref:Cathepsin L-like n=1 Tax=Setaria digitata TaxID=48799 RepID=A0A915PHW4_9BILA
MEKEGEVQAMQKLEAEWKDYKVALGRNYNSTENSYRMAIFESNELLTEKINREYDEGIVSYKTALNNLADLTDEEFKVMNGFKPFNETGFESRRQARQSGRYYEYNRNDRLPDEFDWRNYGFVTPVKDQGECGSCYAFCAVAALETYNKRRNGQLIDLSPQQIVDCTRQLGNNGCDGGTMTRVFKYATQYAVASDERYPYVSSVGQCRWRRNMGVVTDRGYYVIRPGDELALKHAVAVYGPVAVGITGSLREFRFYKSGVFSHPNCRVPDHGVLVVGYGTDPRGGDYWIIKNSWGTGWGQDGYIYMARNRGDMCRITSMASFPM